ncbi:hypothetical protein [Aequorivita capsosiphonis]|uniref:hypothetical protein n=1 Tax=Aequorivita capsosiphonis TaxID=487317 RepID=UPI00041C8029|nr:hypothetical protein [Aequorivita capsosiphonis]
METNIYIQAMEIGYSHNEGITYKDLKRLLQSKTLAPIEGRREYTFIKWFIKNFDAPLMPIQGSAAMKKYYSVLVKDLRDKENLQAYRDFSNKTYFLKGKTVKQYLDYLELKEAREQAQVAQKSSTKAIRIAYWSLSISAILALTSIFMTLYFSITAPKPPYDVYIKEKPQLFKAPEIYSRDAEHSRSPDNEKDGALLLQINQLKDELNNADELLHYYESKEYEKRIRASILSNFM